MPIKSDMALQVYQIILYFRLFSYTLWLKHRDFSIYNWRSFLYPNVLPHSIGAQNHGSIVKKPTSSFFFLIGHYLFVSSR